jgi:hypothetical protein
LRGRGSRFPEVFSQFEQRLYYSPCVLYREEEETHA